MKPSLEEELMLAQAFAHDLGRQLNEERCAGQWKDARISELESSVKLFTETNTALQAALTKTAAELNAARALNERVLAV